MVLGSFMRLFTGLSLAPSVIEKLSAVLEQLRRTAPIQWSPIDNLHITCRFIGAWPEERADDIRAALKTVTVAAPVPIAISRFGFFPTPSSALPLRRRAGRATTPNARVRNRSGAAATGLAAETRPYSPHVTLARIKAEDDIRALRERIAAITDFDFGSFEAREFHLYESILSARGSVYTKQATYDLMREN